MSQTQVPPATQPARPAPKPAAQPLNVNSRQFLTAAGLWALAALAFIGFYFHKFFPGTLTDADAMDFAQIARNMVSGHGYATSILRPLAVTGFSAPDASGTIPDISRAPLYPFVLMLAFLGHGRHGGDTIVVGVSMVLFLLSIYAIYRLARTLFPAPQQAWIALLSAGLYVVSGEALGYAVLGLPATLATLLVTSLMLALYRAADTPKRPATFLSAVWVGVLLALCYLAQYSLLMLVLPVLVYLFFSRAFGRGLAAVGGCALGFFVIAGPWLYRNAVVCHGDPFFTLLFYGIMANTPQYPGFSTVYRSVMPQAGPLVYAYTHLPDVITRDGQGLTYYRDTVLQGLNFFLLAAATVSLLWRAPDKRLNGIRACAAAGIFLVILVTAVFQPSVQMLAPFGPLVIVVAVGFVFTLVGQQPWEPILQRTAIWALALLVCTAGIFQAFTLKSPPADAIPNGMTMLSNEHLAPNQAVMTESASETAWRIGIPSVWLPADNSAYEAVEAACGKSHITIAAILLTPQIARFDIGDGEATPWALLLRDPSAAREHDMADQEWRSFPHLAAEHRVAVPSQYSAYTPMEYAKAGLANIDETYEMNYGSVSDMLTQFYPVSNQAESANQNSTLFLRKGMQ